MLSRTDLAALKRTHPLATVVVGYGVGLQQHGLLLLGCCPFHDDHEPSLLVDPRDDHFHCFGCRAHGDVLDFIQRMERLDFRRALTLLTRAPSTPATLPTGAVARNVMSRRLHQRALPWGTAERDCVETAVTLYHQQLLAAPNAFGYVVQRGLAPDTVLRYRLGYAVGDTLVAALRRHRFSVTAAMHVGLLDRNGHERLTGRVIVPELRNGQAIWLIGRAISPDARRRYLALYGPKPLLGWHGMTDSADVFLTEGPFDWLVLRQWGYPALALVGTHARSELLRSLERFAHIALVLDNDQAGQAATLELQQVLAPRADHIALPTGVKDVAELALRRDGQAIFARAVQQALPARAA
ncbi:MAG TPA: CHC2 zinc finger domain-containing protein [Chloroflexota bacterium]